MEQVRDKINTSEASIIGLYFSGEYCRYCKEFTPALIDAYPKLLSNQIDIVYVSSDKSIDQYNTYRATQPWQALSYEDIDLRLSLREQFNIKTIPALLFFDVSHGTLIEADGRTAIQSDASKAIERLKGCILTEYDLDSSDF